MAQHASARILELWRYGQAGAVNAGFGFLIFSLFVWLGIGIFVAQILATLVGIAFNYVTYSRHVFHESGPAKLRFVISYAFNYAVSLAALTAASTVLQSPYLAGLAAIIVAAIVNYFALKYLVFRRTAQ